MCTKGNFCSCCGAKTATANQTPKRVFKTPAGVPKIKKVTAINKRTGQAVVQKPKKRGFFNKFFQS